VDLKHCYISADLEGVLGVTSPHQCFPASGGDASAYHQAVKQLVLEINTLIAALYHCAKPQRITVNDAHGYMANLQPSALPDTVELLTGKPKPCAMAAGLDATYDAAFFVGYHARVGALNGVLCHTFHEGIYELSMNGVPLGETGVNALYANMVQQVPVVCISGDDVLCHEAKSLLPDIQAVCTKRGLGFSAALHKPWADVQQAYYQAVQAICAVDYSPALIRGFAAPYTLALTLANNQLADIVSVLPGIQRLNGRQIQYQSDSFTSVYQMLQSLYAMFAYPATPAASHLD
jgi:D-amino peptidase